jgi:hypothetical protein
MWIQQPDCVSNEIQQQIVHAINFILESKGMYLVRSNADLEVSANIANSQRYTLQSFYEDFPEDWNWHHYPGTYTTKITDIYKGNTYKAGTLVVDLFGVEQKRVVWWGIADKFVQETAIEGPKHILGSLAKMFSGDQWWMTMP